MLKKNPMNPEGSVFAVSSNGGWIIQTSAGGYYCGKSSFSNDMSDAKIYKKSVNAKKQLERLTHELQFDFLLVKVNIIEDFED